MLLWDPDTISTNFSTLCSLFVEVESPLFITVYAVLILNKHRKFTKSALKRMTNWMVEHLRAFITVEEISFSACLTTLFAFITFLSQVILIITNGALSFAIYTHRLKVEAVIASFACFWSLFTLDATLVALWASIWTWMVVAWCAG